MFIYSNDYCNTNISYIQHTQELIHANEFGIEDFNFRFHFATKKLPLREQEAARRETDTEKTLTLLGFPDAAVHGWKITSLCTPVVSVVFVWEVGIGLHTYGWMWM